MSPYDDSNIFSQILDSKIPSYKIFESEKSLAILDAFPVCPGHALLICKHKGCTDLSEMDADSSSFLCDLPLLCQKVKEGMGVEGVNVVINCGKVAGQEVLHPHVHVIPRKEGDGLIKFPASAKQMLSPDEALPILEKMQKK